VGTHVSPVVFKITAHLPFITWTRIRSRNHSLQQIYFSVGELLAKIIVAKKSGRAANRDPAN